MKKTLCSTALFAGAVLAGSGQASAEEVPPPAVPAPVPPHTVVAGDHLWSISAARLGAPERWVEIFVLNRDLLRSPDVIESGQVLQIPSTPVEIPPDVLASLAPPPAPAPAPALAPVRAHASASTEAPAPTRATPVRVAGVGEDLASIRRCESGGSYQAVSPSGQYRGAYQFDQQTWQSVGGSGDPAAASPAEQDARAGQLRSQRGSSPWPNCG